MKHLSLFALALLLSVPAFAARYTIDPVHSSVNFKVRHMVVSKTRGTFNTFSGWIEFDPKKPKSWHVEAVIDVASVDTGNEGRDAHLRKPDFFDVEKHPEIKFVSTKVTDVKGDTAKLHGKLTMRGVTKDVVLDLEHNGVSETGRKTLAGWTAELKINRMDYGVSFSKVLETGGLAVGEDVWITLEIEAIQDKK